jgi:hypothetical protein
MLKRRHQKLFFKKEDKTVRKSALSIVFSVVIIFGLSVVCSAKEWEEMTLTERMDAVRTIPCPIDLPWYCTYTFNTGLMEKAVSLEEYWKLIYEQCEQEQAERERLDKKAKEAERKAREEVEAQRKREKMEREAAIKRQPFNIQQDIKERKIRLGMTREQVILSWGKPNNIHRTVGSWGVHEQWIYEKQGKYLYFENDILTSWQD